MDVYPCLLIWSLLLKLFLKKYFGVKLMFDISIELSTTNPFRNERVFFCSKLKYTEDLRVYWLSVKQLIFLTFYLKTNKVKS